MGVGEEERKGARRELLRCKRREKREREREREREKCLYKKI